MASPSPQSPKKLGTQVGQGLAKVLGIELQHATPYEQHVTRGESIYSLNGAAGAYIEAEPTVVEYFSQFKPSGSGIGQYLLDFFPFITWIGRYNLKWATGDLTAGITVGCVVIPQGMAYAQLAQLPPEFGLYSSFVGVMIYWFFATSKDITIGPVAVMSTLVGNIVADLPADQRPTIASALSLICGSIVFFIGLFRLGFVVDYIPLPAIAAFMTGSALSITAGQIPKMMGIKGFSTRGPAYEIFINTLKNLGSTKIDAAMGLSALVFLYLLRWIFTSFLPKKFPSMQKTWFFIGTLRTAFIILLYTMISWLVNMNRRDDPMFGILGSIPSGFKHMGVPTIDGDIISSFTSQLPAAVIVLLIEHIAISKSFGRINNYTIDPSQELIAIGITNILGPFFGAYPATGSFSRTAIKSKAGVRTPFAGVITGVVVLLAIYCLTAVFFYIPDASLSAVIIHAVGDLITPPNTVYKFWRVSPVECVIFFLGVLVTVFTNIENGIYSSVGASGALLLFRIAKARGHFMGKVKVHTVLGDHLIAPESVIPSTTTSITGFPGLPTATGLDTAASSSTALTIPKNYGAINAPANKNYEATRNVFLPIDHRDGSNPAVDIVNPYPGVFVYRFTEGFLYPNASHYTEALVEHIFANTRRGNPLSLATKAGDRAWNDAGPKNPEAQAQLESSRPALRAIILDFSSVNNVDITSVQNLLDVRNQLDRYAEPDVVEWHFAAIGNRWTKRALSSAGFGFPPPSSGGREGWQPVFSVAEVGGHIELGGGEMEREIEKSKEADPEAARALTGRRRVVPVGSINLPFFHIDLEGAVESAIRNVR
ncbi:sulfate transporter family-domain-containing protein [Tricharina praecox]|uniref:sulfate transporter family-domain-containing protein n=1 Tax=Tricharina praecox TaxID=43433 RepID=UPI00221E7FA3|nr:sulfate transporter family-domain-containing protein [Tricharina praecox]KAI5844307.1 sulfate transporter family-domain-containing protein [Tricharina praecox]